MSLKLHATYWGVLRKDPSVPYRGAPRMHGLRQVTKR